MSFFFCTVQMTRSLLFLLLCWWGCTNHVRTKRKYCKPPDDTPGIGSTQWLLQYQYDFALSLLASQHACLDLVQSFSNSNWSAPKVEFLRISVQYFPLLKLRTLSKLLYSKVFFSRCTAAKASGLPWSEASSYLRKSKWNVESWCRGQDLTSETWEVCAVIAILRLQ